MNSRDLDPKALEDLARRVAEGDLQARGAFADALNPHLARIVRRALGSDGPPSELARRIAQTAERLKGGTPGHKEREPWPNRVARNLGQAILSRLGGATEGIVFRTTSVA